jgi:hypothetical protein
VREYVGVVADEDQFVLEHEQRPDVEEVVEREHGEHGVNPLADEVGLGVVPVGHQRQLLLVYQPQLVLLVEGHLLELQVAVAVLEQLHQPLHLKPTVRLLYRQLNVLLVVLVDRQSLHLYDIYQVSQHLLVEAKERIVRHHAEHALGDAHFQLTQLALLDRPQRVLVGKGKHLVAFAFDDGVVRQRAGGGWFDVAEGDVEPGGRRVDAGVIVDADADAVEPSSGVDVREEVVGVEALVKGGLGALEAEDETLEVGVAVGHELDGLLLGLVVEALLHAHARREDELRRLHLDVVLLLLRVQDLALQLPHLPLPRQLLHPPLTQSENGEVLHHLHVPLPALPVDLRHQAGLSALARGGEVQRG